eukprot:g5115.t1
MPTSVRRSRRKHAPLPAQAKEKSPRKSEKKKKQKKSATKRRRRSSTPSRRGWYRDAQWGGSVGLSPKSSTKVNAGDTPQWGGSKGLSPAQRSPATRVRRSSRKHAPLKKAKNDSMQGSKTSASGSIVGSLKLTVLFFAVVAAIGYVTDKENNSKHEISAGLPMKTPSIGDDITTRECPRGLSYDENLEKCVDNVCPPIKEAAHDLKAGADCPGGPASTSPKCNFECENTDYTIVGQQFISCDFDGKWESYPHCRIADNAVTNPDHLIQVHGTIFPDNNDDGRVNREEIQVALGDRWSKDYIASIFGVHDKNNDEHLDDAEYRSVVSFLSGSP